MNLPVVNSINDLTIKVGQASSSLQLELYEGFENLIETVKKSVDRILFNMELSNNTLISEMQFQDANYIRYSEKILNALAPLSDVLSRSNENEILSIKYQDLIYQDLMLEELKKINEILSIKYQDLIYQDLMLEELKKINENISLSENYLDLIVNTLKSEMQFQDANYIQYSEKILNALSQLKTSSLSRNDGDEIFGIKQQYLMLYELEKINENTSLSAEYLDLIIDTLKDNSELIKLQENMNLNTEYLDLIVDTLKNSNQLEKEKFAFDKLQAIKAEEDRIEQKSIKEKEEKQESVAKEKGGFLSGILLAIAGIVAGFVVGFVDSLRKTLSFATKILKNGFLGIINLVKNTSLFKLIQFYFSATISTIVGVFKNIYNFFAKSNLFQGLKLIIDGIGDYFKLIKNTPIFSADDRAIVDIIKKIASNIKSFFMNILRIGDAVGEVSKIVVTVGGKIVSAFQTVKTFVIDLFAKVGAFFKNISGITTIFGKIGIVLGKIFFPITVLLTLFDTIKGAIEGFKEEGIIGGIKGALAGFLASVVGVPLDLLKNLLSWLAEKLGFENVSKTLDSFNFVDLIKSGVKGIFQFFQDLFTDPLKAFGLDKPTELLQKAGNVFKSIFGGIVEFLASIAEFIPIKGKDIAESIRKFKPEETVATPTASGGLSGAELQTRSQEIENQRSSAPIIVTNAPTTVNAPTNTSMNSTTALPASSSRSRPSPVESDYRDPVFMGA